MMRQNLKILIVEDNPMMRRVLGRILAGNQITEASDGSQALEVLETDDGYDLILSDFEMGTGMNGGDFYCELVRKHATLADRLVFVTGTEDPDHRKFISETLRPRVSKPFRSDELNYVISAIVGPG